MSCDQAQERLSAAFDAELHTADADLDRHVAACPDCTAFLHGITQLRSAIRVEPIDAPPDVTARVTATVRARAGDGAQDSSAAAAGSSVPEWASGGRREDPAVTPAAASSAPEGAVGGNADEPAVTPAVARSLREPARGAAVGVVRAPARERTRLGVPGRVSWAAVVATFLVAFLAGAAFIGVGPRGVERAAAAGLPARLLAAQAELRSLTAEVVIAERGAGERELVGDIAYVAPESLALRLRPPDGAELVTVVDEERGWSATGTGRALAVEGREPLSTTLPAPLDVVLPVDGFRLEDPARPLLRGQLDGRAAVGVRVTAAQLDALLGGLQRAGGLRDVHPADEAELWLDERLLVPLRLRVLPAEGAERQVWAVRRGYEDRAGVAVLDVTFRDVEVNQEVPPERFPAAPADAERLDEGFVPAPADAVDAPVPGWLPEGMRPYRSGTVAVRKGPPVAVRTWTDGRSWVRVRATRSWWSPRLFGDLGEVVRRVDLGEASVGYAGDAGRRLGLHGDGIDVELSGSLAETDLLRTAASLPVAGHPVPADWAEAEVASLADARAALPGLLQPSPDGRLEGFDRPSVRLTDGAVTMTWAGPGSRAVVLSQAPGDRLGPPLEPDVAGVEVRGHPGRWTPALGELEWVESGLVLSLRGPGLTPAELVAIARQLSAS